MARGAKIGCDTCNQLMRNVEWEYSDYYSYVCVNKECRRNGIIQDRGAYGNPIKEKK